ncbi:MAG: T9SS type A sorting domain-containing protein [Chitinophagales bacterium]
MTHFHTSRLTAYSLFSSAFLTIPNNSEGQIIYTDIDPDISISYGTVWNDVDSATVKIDFNLDQINDVTFYLYSTGSMNLVSSSKWVYLSLSLPTGNAFIYHYASEYSYGVARLGEGEKIGGEADWDFKGSMLFSAMWSRSLLSNSLSSTGEWRKGEDEFIGIKFNINGHYHYGWIRLTVTNSPGKKPNGEIIIKDYAYNPNAYEQIITPVHLLPARFVVLDNLKNNTSAHNFNLEFKVPEKTKAIEEYRMYIVPEINMADVNLESALHNQNYSSVIPKKSDITFNLTTLPTDWNGSPIIQGINYVAYVVSYNQSLQMADLSISEPSNKIQLLFGEDASAENTEEVLVNLSGNELNLEFMSDAFMGGNAYLFSADGRKIMDQTIQSGTLTMLIDVPAGVYFVQVIKDDTVFNKKILIAG